MHLLNVVLQSVFGHKLLFTQRTLSNLKQNKGKSLVWEEKIVGAATIGADSRV